MGLVAYSSTFRTRIVRNTLGGRNVTSILRGRGVSSIVHKCIHSIAKISVFICRSRCSGTLHLLRQGRVVPRRLECYPRYNSSRVGFILGGDRQIHTIITTIVTTLSTTPPNARR